MSDTQLLLSKISALRQRLEQAHGLPGDTVGAGVSEAPPAPAGRLRHLEQRVTTGFDQNPFLEASLKDVEEAPPPPSGEMPGQLTARARRILQRGRELLAGLRTLGDEMNTEPAGPGEPLQRYHRDTAAMLDSTLRMVQSFPDSATTQLRLCEGIEAILTTVTQRAVLLTSIVSRRRLEAKRIDTLTDLLQALYTGQSLEVKPFIALAENVLADTQEGAPIRFHHADPEVPARFVACHGLNVAQVIARVVRHDPDLRSRPLEPVLAALIHDVGMLCVPAELLKLTTPPEDVQRRAIESHVRVSASLAARLLPSGAWLSEAAGAHHERMDGTGYPDGLREYQLPPLVRLLSVCDTYAALCSPRPHRPAKESRTALTDTLLLAEKGGLDRDRAERLLQLSFYPAGSVVELADGAVAVVLAAHHDCLDLQAPSRPVVALLTDTQGRLLPLPQPLDLSLAEGRSIVRSLPVEERRDLLGRRYPQWAA